MKPYFSKFQANKCLLKPFILVPEMHQNAGKCTLILNFFGGACPHNPLTYSLALLTRCLTSLGRFGPLKMILGHWKKNILVAQIKFLGLWPKTRSVQHWGGIDYVRYLSMQNVNPSHAAIKISINATAAEFICKNIFPIPVQIKKIIKNKTGDIQQIYLYQNVCK